MYHFRYTKWYTPDMPTTYPRTQITRGPRVQRILDIGARHLPDASPGDILVTLAEERAREIEAAERSDDPLAGLVIFGSGGRNHQITRQMIEDALDED